MLPPQDEVEGGRSRVDAARWGAGKQQGEAVQGEGGAARWRTCETPRAMPSERASKEERMAASESPSNLSTARSSSLSTSPSVDASAPILVRSVPSVY